MPTVTQMDLAYEMLSEPMKAFLEGLTAIHDGALPWVPIQLGWPWVMIADLPVFLQIGWNLLLFFSFGLIHSLLAQPIAHRALEGRKTTGKVLLIP